MKKKITRGTRIFKKQSGKGSELFFENEKAPDLRLMLSAVGATGFEPATS
ncbi:hypothetical protein [Anaerostipes caccae]|uniref:Uncharacterized protein n=1 Tax=Anaerostipes caccae (strain DSM 14662 / CCUG 47493 / JCM 13470 / NCIMB 13811 / L1-92) TaxID=411490 RepID=B0MFS0_ANACD|nr:hypothetical protein [Anaerostipes caccae]EDR96940.1 hypothetical protein ANACAC_02169 [Anaerostipes caccae L1-92]MCB6294719.1 hypothetical protein [Anaerostipes caccae]MCB6374019.1 hypothetical protein [Anaerostipes caccae]MCB7184659.1 hypothetical protein [Anaerostipes caccae]MCB7188927.1 hypothetical protein [Anaerostipes caccae]